MILHVATFFTHHDALVFAQLMQQQDIGAKCCPTPRELSSSCGTAVQFFLDAGVSASPYFSSTVEQLCKKSNDTWMIIYDNK